MHTTELDAQRIAAAAAGIAENTPFVMLNLVRYKEQADYGDSGEYGACSGREAYYQRYVAAFNQVAAMVDQGQTFKAVFVGSVLARLVGPADEPWDDVVLVEYASFAAFRAIVESPEYKHDADPHRKAALEDWRLMAVLKQNFG